MGAGVSLGSRGRAPAVVVASLALVGCGGGQDSGFPSLATSYGTVGEERGRFTQTYTMNDGELEAYTMSGRITIDTQAEGTWTGRVFRCEGNQLSWWYSSGTMAGTIDRDHSLNFTLTQDRWKYCTALAPGEYSGVSDASTIYAAGVTRLRCDDGREGTVEEMIWVKAAPHRATTRSSSQHVRGDSPPWPVVVFRAMSIESPSAGLRPGQSGQSPGRCGRWATRRPTASSASKSPSSPFSPFRCGAPYEAHDPSGGLTGSFSGV